MKNYLENCDIYFALSESSRDFASCLKNHDIQEPMVQPKYFPKSNKCSKPTIIKAIKIKIPKVLNSEEKFYKTNEEKNKSEQSKSPNPSTQ